MDARTNSKLPAFEDICQVEVEFLGQCTLIGRIGEEDSLRLAIRFEIDAGEVTQAVLAPIEPSQAMLMAAVLAYEQLEQAEINTTAGPA